MKKTCLLGAAAIVSAFLVSSCNKGSEQGGIPVEFQDFKCENYSFTTDSLSGERDSLYMQNIREAMLPTHIGKHDISQLRDSLFSLARILPLKGGGIEPEPMPEFQGNLTTAPGNVESSSNVKLSVVFLDSDLIVWQSLVSDYIEGAAHGSYNYLYLNYCIAENKILALCDLFKPGSLGTVTKLVREKLAEPDSGAFEEQAAEAELPAQFYLSPDAITFVYQPYEVGPYAAGTIKVEIPAYLIEDCLTPLGRHQLGVQ